MKYLKKTSIILIIFYLVTTCSYKKVNELHGTANLNSKAEILKENLHNKNDVVNFLGFSSLQEFNEIDTWYYFELRETRNLLGKKIVLKNDVLILNFDRKGILSKKTLLDKNIMKSINIDEDETVSKGIDSSLIKNILSSTRKRMKNLTNRNR